MSVKEAITTDNEIFKDPDWEAIERWIRKLDGHALSDLFIGDIGGRDFMAISGGNKARFLIVVQKSDETSYTLIKPQKDKRDIVIVIGGNPSYRPREECQGLKIALAAAKTYFDSGELDPQFTWRQSEP